MKALILTMMLLFSGGVNEASETYVYICTGPKSTKYHITSQCRGLKSCSGEVKKVTLKKAKELGKKSPCGWCYKDKP
jgi:hypothetical protein